VKTERLAERRTWFAAALGGNMRYPNAISLALAVLTGLVGCAPTAPPPGSGPTPSTVCGNGVVEVGEDCEKASTCQAHFGGKDSAWLNDGKDKALGCSAACAWEADPAEVCRPLVHPGVETQLIDRSCADDCGRYIAGPPACQCDFKCLKEGDCCPDYAGVCKLSCAGFCGLDPGPDGGCGCGPACADKGTCCPDLAGVCGSGAVCGNGELEAGEKCEPGGGNAKAYCQDLGDYKPWMMAPCLPDCSGWDKTKCVACECDEQGEKSFCGNMDGYASGTAVCDGCQWDVKGCKVATCGDGVVSPKAGEVCEVADDWVVKHCKDLPNSPWAGGLLTCKGCKSWDESLCGLAGTKKAWCGNGKIDAGEDCDLGAGADKPMAQSTCGALGYTTSAGKAPEIGKSTGVLCDFDCHGWRDAVCQGYTCGDGKVTRFEACDGPVACTKAGYAAGTSIECSKDCKKILDNPCSQPICGDSKIVKGEVCDGDARPCGDLDPSLKGTATCKPGCGAYDLSACQPVATCGNGVKELGEACDGGNKACSALNSRWIGTATCKADCKGYDGATCKSAKCGNGKVDPGEVCESGQTKACTALDSWLFTGGTATCSECTDWDTQGCTKNACGNGKVDPGEECDGGKTACASLDGKWCGGTAMCDNCKWNTWVCLSNCAPAGACGSTCINGTAGWSCGTGLYCKNPGAFGTCVPSQCKACGSTCQWTKGTCTFTGCGPACTPTCAGKQCGADGCGGTCGTCSGGGACNAGLCQTSAVACIGGQQGEATKTNVTIGAVKTAAVTAKWSLSKNGLDDVLVKMAYKWNSATGGQNLPGTTRMYLQVRASDGLASAWIVDEPLVPEDGAGFPGLAVAESPAWNQLFCTLGDKYKKNCWAEDKAKAFWKAGFCVTDFAFDW